MFWGNTRGGLGVSGRQVLSILAGEGNLLRHEDEGKRLLRLRLRRDEDCVNLQGPLGDQAVLQGTETETETEPES